MKLCASKASSLAGRQIAVADLPNDLELVAFYIIMRSVDPSEAQKCRAESYGL